MLKKKAIAIVRQNRINYNTISVEWDKSRHHPTDLKLKLLKAIKDGDEVLDLGCGNGLMMSEVLKQGSKKYIGLDNSLKLIALAKKRYTKEIKEKKVKFEVGDATKLPFDKNSFDFIFSFAVMHHIPSKELQLKFLSEIFNTLKAGGKAVVVNWNLLNGRFYKKFKVEEQLSNTSISYDYGDLYIPWKATSNNNVLRYIHIFSKKELTELAKEAGFKKCRINYYNQMGKMIKNGEEMVLRLEK